MGKQFANNGRKRVKKWTDMVISPARPLGVSGGHSSRQQRAGRRRGGPRGGRAGAGSRTHRCRPPPAAAPSHSEQRGWVRHLSGGRVGEGRTRAGRARAVGAPASAPAATAGARRPTAGSRSAARWACPSGPRPPRRSRRTTRPCPSPPSCRAAAGSAARSPGCSRWRGCTCC